MPTSTSFGIAETDDYVRKILGAAGSPPKGADVDQTVEWLLPHVIHQESRGNAAAVSSKGALGRLQVMPATAAAPGFGIAPAKDHSPEELERVGKAYLKAMVARYPGRPDLALAAYNAGPGRADKWANVHVAASTVPAEAAPEGNRPPPFRDDAGLDPLTAVAPSLGELPTVDRTKAQPTWRDYFTDVVGNDSSIAAFHNIAEDAGYHVDESFDIGKIPEKEWAQITQGIPEELQPRLGGAVSMEHLQVLAARARGELQAEEEMAQFGGWGVAGRFALNMLDPASLAVGVATGGVGTATKGLRLAKAARAALAAGELADARVAVEALGSIAKAGKWAGAGRAATMAGLENAALESALDQGNITRDGWDVAMAGVTGGLLGGLSSRVFRGSELDGLRTAYARATEELNLAELSHTISVKRAELDTRLKWLHADGDVAKAQDELKQLEASLAGERAKHESDLRAAATARRESLSATAAGATKRSELAGLRRTTEGLRKQAKAADDLEPQIRERMLREDIESMGEGEARSKQRTKIRNGAAKAEAKGRLETIRANLQRAETALARGQAAEDARVELRKLERREKSHPGDALSTLDEPGRNAFAERELAMAQRHRATLGPARERLKAAEDSVESRRASLQKEIDNLEQLRAAGVRASDKQVAEIFGADSASAARFLGFDEGTHPHLDDDSGLPSGNPVVAEMGAQGNRGKVVDLLKFRKGPFATFGMVLRGSPNEKVRNLLGRMVGNSVGTKDGSATTVGASEIAHLLRQRYEAKFNQAVTPTYLDWAQRNGIGMIQRQTRLAREDFMSDVGRLIRGDETRTDPAVKKAAGDIRKIFAEYLKDGKEAGVKGFENLEPRADYLPRVFDFHSLHEIEGRIGTGNLELLLQRAIQSANEDIPDALAARIAKPYLNRMKDLRVGADVNLLNGLKWDDVGFLRQFLKDAGVGSEEIESVVNDFAALNARRERQTEGSFRNAKHRVQMDENYSMHFRDQQAAREGRIEDIEVRVADLFENNVEALFGRYNRTVAGHVGLAKVGIKSRRDFDLSIEHIERELAGDKPELDRVKDYATAAYELVTGTPIEKSTNLTRIGRAVRDWNFTTTMGQSGWAQFPDFAGLLSKGYLGHTLKYFPEVFRTIRRTDGKIDLDFYREQEAWVGLGTDLFNNKVYSSFDWGEEGEGLSGALGKFEHGVRVAGRGVQKASGLSFLTEMAQRGAGRIIVQRLVKDVLEGGALSPDRALQLGLTDAMKTRIAAQLKEHTVWADGDFGGKVQIVNYVAWKDIEARDSMLYAVSREARRLVQEEDLGDTTLWMHKGWGKVLAQFRRFPLVSYSKQLLHGIAHADAEEATRVMVSMALAAMAYNARHHTALALKEAGGASEEELQAYREKYLGLDRLTAAAIANSSYSSILPGLWDTGQYYATGTRFFDTRTSGLGSDIITGNPTYGLFRNAGQALAGSAQAVVLGDRQFDKKDAAAWRRLAPFQNVLGMDLPFSLLTSGLPDKDQDADPDHLDWLINDNPQ